MTAKPLTGTEIARLTAIITGGGYKRSNSKEVAMKRFRNVAALNAIHAPDEYLKMTFEEASAALRDFMDSKKPKAPMPTKPAGTQPAGAPAKAVREHGGKRTAILEAAQRGELPTPHDFSAPSHARYRKKLADLIAMVEAGEITDVASRCYWRRRRETNARILANEKRVRLARRFPERMVGELGNLRLRGRNTI